MSAHAPAPPGETAARPAVMPRVPVEALRGMAMRILSKVEVGESDAAVVADCLLDADRRGVHSHGLARLPSYVAQIEAAEVDVAARPVLRGEAGPAAWVDANHCLGAVSSVLAMDAAIERALGFGIGAVTVREGNHFGAAAYYTQRAARRGLVGVTVTGTPGVMAPSGGTDPVLGNNPLSVAAPSGDGRAPFVLDMAQTAVARGRIKLAEEAGEEIPAGWALDSAGRPTTDPTAALDGALLPFGGYKASALTMALEVLTAALSGSPLSFELRNTGFTGDVRPGLPADGQGSGVGVLHLAIDPARFGADAGFPERVRALGEAVSSVRRAPGVETAPVVPGAPEAERAARADRDGVAVHPPTGEALRALADRLGLVLPPGLRLEPDRSPEVPPG